MDSCETCQRLREIAVFLSRHEWYAGQQAWAELTAHQTRDHVLHIAHAPDSRFSANAESGEQSQEF